MADDRSPIRIGEVRMRVPGVEPASAARLGRRVGELLAADLPAGEPRRLGAVRVRVSAGEGVGEAELARRIARAIRGGIG